MSAPSAPQPDFNQRLDQFLAALTAKVHAYHAKAYPQATAALGLPYFTCDVGPKYVRVVKRDASSGSAYAFIDRTNGNILKPAGFKSPAKHARGNIFAADLGMSACGPNSVTYLR